MHVNTFLTNPLLHILNRIFVLSQSSWRISRLSSSPTTGSPTASRRKNRRNTHPPPPIRRTRAFQSFSAKPTLSLSFRLAHTGTDLWCALVFFHVRCIPDFSCGMVPSCGLTNSGDGRPTTGDPSPKLKPMVATLSRCHTLVIVMA